MTPMRFFFYGTLAQHADNALSRFLTSKIARKVPASVPGRLFAILSRDGAYPALVEGAIEGPMVLGTVYEMKETFTAEDLARLDAYEEYLPDAPERSLYLRAERQVRLMSGEIVPAETYLYNKPIPRTAPLIPKGDFWAWVRRSGGRAFEEGRR